MGFDKHIQAAANKASVAASVIAKIMPNARGASQRKMKLIESRNKTKWKLEELTIVIEGIILSSVVHSVLLYGAPTGSPTLAYDPRGVGVLAAV